MPLEAERRGDHVGDGDHAEPSQTSDTSQKLDYSTWREKQQAADEIGCSTKTIEQLAKDGQIQQAVWRPNGRGARRAVYHPDDVARIAKERQPGLPAFVLPAGQSDLARPNRNGTGHGPPATLATLPAEDVWRGLLAAALRAVVVGSEKPTSENSEKLWLTLDEAAEVSGLPRATLRRLIVDEERLYALKTGRGWRIRRRDLEGL
jgi:excisionase family DNA binding protein